ncbi:MAG: exodeoxyribonuclease VII small subunit [Lachnospiraceae bacterium]|nr:exodeoxyribonuclease VII small subunit [Candidatus Equihabitans merdae]
MAKNDKTIEEGFEALEEMIRTLESEDVSLEESFKTYQQGMKLLKSLNERMDKVEKQMQIMDEAGKTEAFE